MDQRRSWQLGFVMVPAEVFELMTRVSQGHVELAHRFGDQFVKLANQVARYRNTDKIKAAILAQRDAVIDQARQAGIEDPEAILSHLREHHTDLVRRVRNAKVMMREYLHRKRTANLLQ
jgi:hypothetical protein